MHPFCTAIAAALFAAPLAAETFNASAEFSPTANPTGVWSYGLRPDAPGSFEPLPHTVIVDQIDFWDRDLPFPHGYPKIGHNGTGQTQFWGGPEGPVAAGELIMHPGPLPAVLRFTAPFSSSFTAIVHARAASACATAAAASLWVGTTAQATSTLGGNGSMWDTSNLVTLAAGQTLDVVVTDGGNGINCDHVAVSLIVTSDGCGPADLGGTGGSHGPDGHLDNNDFVVFIDLFFAHDPAVDLGATGGTPGPDDAWDNNDFVIFIDRFFAGCA